MAINISVSGLTTQQQQDIGNAFDAVYNGRADAGKTKAQWVELQLLRYMKQIVKTWKDRSHREAIQAEQAQVDAEYPEA